MLGLAATSGCFGDWVSARPRPRTDQTSSADASAVASAPAAAEPAEPCRAYLAAVAARCERVLDGVMDERCHAQIVRVMALFHEGDEPLYHQAATTQDREAACAQHLRALPQAAPPHAAGAELGPRCRAWAQALRRRCVEPLATMPPDLRACGADLLAFESTLGGITFGRPQDYEPLCRDAVQRLEPGPPG